MSQERHRRAKDLFLQALALPAERRSGFLEQACEADRALRGDVESLLEHDRKESALLDEPALGAGFRVGAPRTLPEKIGPYRIQALLGEGGMGHVYRAQQPGTKRTVALKVLRMGLASPVARKRFEQEVQLLGQLEHPGIARIYDAGRAEQPYFAMELVTGAPITRFADARRLDARARLALLVQVCDAVQHAHRHGVVHRDLKPDNILVDEAGRVKVLDFGIARAVDPGLETTALRTETGLLVGTVRYMSPEQAAGVGGDIDPRIDVYALGVIGYELVTGHAPYDLEGKTTIEVLRIIREQEPRPLGAWRKELRGDLETIFQKALEKEPTARYASAADLAADVERYLADEPILARPTGWTGRARKFARRNRTLLVALGIALTGPLFALLGRAVPAYAALVVGLLGTTFGLLRAVRARRAAEQEADKARAVNTFLHEMLSSVDPGAPGRAVEVQDLLDRAADRVGAAFARQPEVEGSLRLTLGTSYRGLGLYERAQEQLEAALEVCRSALGPAHEDSLNALGWLAIVQRERGRLDAAEELQGRLLALRREAQGEDHPETLKSLGQMSLLLKARGQRAQATHMLRQVVAGLRKELGDRHPDTLVAMGILGDSLRDTGELEPAEDLLQRCLSGIREVLGPDHPDALKAMSNLAAVLHLREKFAEAEELCRATVDAHRRALGADHPSTLFPQLHLGRLLVERGVLEEAAALLEETRAGFEAAFGAEHVSYMAAAHALGDALLRLERAKEAEAPLQRAFELAQRKLSQDDWRRDAYRSLFGACLARLGKRDEARPHLEQSAHALTEALGKDHRETVRARERLASLASSV